MKRLLSITEPSHSADQAEAQLISAKQRLNQQLSIDGHVESQGRLSSRGFAPVFWQRFYERAIWHLPFRPWFLLAGISAVTSMVLWLCVLNGVVVLSTAHFSSVVWHVHEMLFGFAAMVAAAFLLTAAQTWTGHRSVHGQLLIALTLIWLVARCAVWGMLWLPSDVLRIVAVVAQGVWWCGVIVALLSLLLKSQQYRHLIFIPLLSVMMLINLTMLLVNSDGIALHLSRSVMLFWGVLIGIVGGRVIPFFTEKGLAAKASSLEAPVIIKKTPRLDMIILCSSLIGAVGFFVGGLLAEVQQGDVEIKLIKRVAGGMMMLVGSLHGLRLYGWQPWKTGQVPLLWSLHIAYGFLAAGLILFGANYGLFFNDTVFVYTTGDALHLITIGAIGLMMVSMMARVSLGHTGRALRLHYTVAIAFFLLILAAVIRFSVPLLGRVVEAWNVSGLLWIVAFVIFLIVYFPILFQPRQR